jgi:hypothetical protein
MNFEADTERRTENFTGQSLANEFQREDPLGSRCPVNFRGKIRWAFAAPWIARGKFVGQPLPREFGGRAALSGYPA